MTSPSYRLRWIAAPGAEHVVLSDDVAELCGLYDICRDQEGGTVCAVLDAWQGERWEAQLCTW